MANLFHNGLTTVEVECPPSLVRHLINFMAPGAPEGDDARWTVESVLAPIGAERSMAHITRLVTGEYNEPWVADDALDLLISLRTGVRVMVDRPNRRIRIVSEDETALAVETYRSVRQLLVWSLLAHGATIVHASAVWDDHGVTLFVGEKGSGKTTAMLQALCTGQFGFVGNDRVLLWRSDADIRAFGWPATAYVGLGSIAGTVGLKRLKGVHESVSSTARILLDHQCTSDQTIELMSRIPISAIGRHKIFLLPGEIASLTRTAVSSGGLLNRVIFPHFTPDRFLKTSVKSIGASDLNLLIRREILDVPVDYPDLLGLRSAFPSEAAQAWPIDWALDVEGLTVSGPNLAAWLARDAR